MSAADLTLPPGEPSLKPPRFRTARTVGALVLREMATTYGRSPGGYLWALISPIGAIALMAAAFSMMVHKPALGTSFLLFYATGFLPFDMFSQISARVGQALRYSRPLLAYPCVTWLDAVLGRFLLTLLTQSTVFVLVILAIIFFIDTHGSVDILPILTGLGLAALLGLGVGMVNGALIGYLPIWERIWTIVTRPLFLGSGIFFLYEGMPAAVQNILWWNPVLHAIAEVRTGFYPAYHAEYVSLAFGYGVALVLILLGLVFLRQGYLRVIQR